MPFRAGMLMRRAALALAPLVAVGVVSAPPAAAHVPSGAPCWLPPPVIGITVDGRMISFDGADPDTVRVGPAVTGLREPGERIVALAATGLTDDQRGVVWGWSSEGRVYAIDHYTGAATGGEHEIEEPLPDGDVDLEFSVYDEPMVRVGSESWRLDATGKIVEKRRSRDVTGPGPPTELEVLVGGGGVIDVAGEWLWDYAEEDYVDMAHDDFVKRWPLLVDVRSPAGLEYYCSTKADFPSLLLTADPTGERSLLYDVDWDTGIVAPVGPIGVDAVVQDIVLDPIAGRMPDYGGGWRYGSEREGGTFEVVRTSDPRPELTMKVVFEEYAGSGSAATAGRDFDPREVTVTVPRGQASAEFPAPILDDDEYEDGYGEALRAVAVETRLDGHLTHTDWAQVLYISDDDDHRENTSGSPGGKVPAEPPRPIPPEAFQTEGPSMVTPGEIWWRTLVRRGLPVAVRCGAACSARVSLERGRRARGSALSRRTVRLRAAGERSVRLRLRRFDGRRVRSGGRLRVRVTARDQQGRTVQLQRTVRVRGRNSPLPRG